MAGEGQGNSGDGAAAANGGDGQNTQGNVANTSTDNQNSQSAQSNEEGQQNADGQNSEEGKLNLNPLFSFIKEKHPDKQFANDNDYHATGLEYINNLNTEIQGLNDFKTKSIESQKKIVNLLESDDTFSNIVKQMLSGAPLMEAIARNIDIQNIAPVEGDPDYESWDKNVQERLKASQDKENKRKSLETNQQESMKTFEAFMADNKMDEPRAKEFLQTINKTFDEVNEGKLSKEFLSMMYKALNFDRAVEAAEINGKNTAITKDLNEEKKGDGVPDLSTNNLKSKPPKQQAGFMSDVAAHSEKEKVL